MQLVKEIIGVFAGLAFVVLSALAILLLPIVLLALTVWAAAEVLFS